MFDDRLKLAVTDDSMLATRLTIRTVDVDDTFMMLVSIIMSDILDSPLLIYWTIHFGTVAPSVVNLL